MLKQFTEIKNNVKFTFSVNIDNIIFKLHYRLTTIILLVATILVCSRQYIGEHIRCDVGEKKASKEFLNMINTYCFFMSTYTVSKHYNSTVDVPHPGVGPQTADDEVKHHAYYQWVPFVLFLQAILFYIPHYIWRAYDNGQVKKFVNGMELLMLSTHDSEIKFTKYPGGDTVVIPCKEDGEKKLRETCKSLIGRLHTHRIWVTVFVCCEILNLINVVANMYFTDFFLGGQFLQYGPDVVRYFNMNSTKDRMRDPAEIVFPKVTKCTFFKYGPSGSLDIHRAICVMALNVINEKIYVLLWFWFVILTALTACAVVWRFVTIVLQSRSEAFNRITFTAGSPVILSRDSIRVITYQCHFGDWLFLLYIGNNLDGFLFKKLIDMFTVMLSEIHY